MDMKILLFVLLLGKSALIVIGFNKKLALDYLEIIKNAQYVTVFMCDDYMSTIDEDIVSFTQELSHKNLRYDFQLNSVNRKELNKTLARNLTAIHSVILDCSYNSRKCDEILCEASDKKYFNLTYNWLILDRTNRNRETVFESALQIGINSRVTYATSADNGSTYSLMDVFSNGRHLGDRLQYLTWGSWDDEQGFLFNQNRSQLYTSRYRGNFNLLQLRAVIVIDSPNFNKKDVVSLLAGSMSSGAGISQSIKYHNDLLNILKDMFNFTIKYRITRRWIDAIEIVQQNEVDLVATGMLVTKDELPVIDIYQGSWKFEVAFIYRLTAELENMQSLTRFFMPFSTNVWIFILLLILLIVITMKIISKLKNDRFHIINYNLYEYFVYVVGGVAQQGINLNASFQPLRIVILTLLLLSLMLYNYYTSTIVGDILSNPINGPGSIQEIIDSPLTLSFEDISYNRLIFVDEENSTMIREMYLKKIHPKRAATVLPVFTDIITAVTYLKSGHYALHSETASAFPEIAKVFDANDVCDLRVVPGLKKSSILAMVQPKNSMYTEMFKIGMTRARETGLTNRWHRIHKKAQPTCMSGAQVHPVSIQRVQTALYIYAIGLILSLIIFLIELTQNVFNKDDNQSPKFKYLN